MDEQIWTYLVPGNTMKLQPGMSAMRDLHPRRVRYEAPKDIAITRNGAQNPTK
jgi:hypothetical protein